MSADTTTLTAAQQPTEGEEIMVNTPHGVFILPLHPSGLSSGPRFVVHVPELQRESVTVRYDLSPAQTESAIRDALIRMGWTPPEGLNSFNRIYLYLCYYFQNGEIRKHR